MVVINLSEHVVLSWCCQICVRVNGEVVLSDTTPALRNIWEETSFQLEQLQANPACVENEQRLLQYRSCPSYVISFDPQSVMSRTVQTPRAGHYQRDLLY